MIVNCLNCGKSVSSKINLCPYCKWEVAPIALHEEKPAAVHGYHETLRAIPRMIAETVLRYAHK